MGCHFMAAWIPSHFPNYLNVKEQGKMQHAPYFWPLCFYCASFKLLIDVVVFWAVWLDNWAEQHNVWSKIIFGDTWESVLSKRGPGHAWSGCFCLWSRQEHQTSVCDCWYSGCVWTCSPDGLIPLQSVFPSFLNHCLWFIKYPPSRFLICILTVFSFSNKMAFMMRNCTS